MHTLADQLGNWLPMLALAAEQGTEHGAHGSAEMPIAHAVEGMKWAGWILWLPLISLVLCGLYAALGIRNKIPAWSTTLLLAVSFVVTVLLYWNYTEPVTIHLFDWFNLHWGGADGEASSFIANFSLYVDRLTLLWMLFVTGLGTLITLYASEYMEHDLGPSYSRFFAGISVFLFAMSALVMGDNLVMLYLGWEGVGFASYWLIGYFYQKPSAVAAAKKAFIVNRIGDLGLAIGIWFIWLNFGTVEYAALFEAVQTQGLDGTAGGWTLHAIPFLIMVGAFGKSAQIPLYVWLPDAMEGPTPVSALIHAATMVTAGIYLIARAYPVFTLVPEAMTTVAWIGCLTAFLAATIGMAQFDIKRIWAYSTVSQLGYMFLGLGVLSSFGAAYHVFTHAFFKAVLFLSAGAVMHGFAGQLDLRKLSGLAKMRGWGITSWTMLYACACLAGLPIITNGFWSKDKIMAEAYMNNQVWGAEFLGGLALLTALLTAYYAFRVWFRVCAGPSHYEMGEEHHGDEHDHGDDHGHAKPHPPRLAINLVLVLITLGAIWSIFLDGWTKYNVTESTAAAGVAAHHAETAGFWADPHRWMPWVAGTLGILGIAVAWYFHLANRRAADSLKSALLSNPATRWLPLAMENKWYVDEMYHALLRAPLWAIGHILNLFDRYIIDGAIVDGLARLPKGIGRLFQPMHNGVLQNYAWSMAIGLALVSLAVLFGPALIESLSGYLGFLAGGGG